MISWLPQRRNTPIGVDLGTRSVKLVQFSADYKQLIDASRWDLNVEEGKDASTEELVKAIGYARAGRKFRGRNAVLCLSDRHLFTQNLRIATGDPSEMDRLVLREAAGRLPFPAGEAELQYLEAADIRQGDSVMREVIVMACHRPVLEQCLAVLEQAGLRPVAVDVEPVALQRGAVRQFRRGNDREERTMSVHIGHSRTVIVIAQAEKILFIKYIELGGRQMDESVARHLHMTVPEAAALRKHNGDRRSDQQDPVVAQSVQEALRPIIDRMCAELSMCIRYHSVTFRGQPLVRLLLGGGEASQPLLDELAQRINLKCQLSEPLRGFTAPVEMGRNGQWDVATGLALREET